MASVKTRYMTPIEAAEGYIRICRITEGNGILETDAWDSERKQWSEDEYSRRICMDIIFGLNRKHVEISEQEVVKLLRKHGCKIEPFTLFIVKCNSPEL